MALLLSKRRDIFMFDAFVLIECTLYAKMVCLSKKQLHQ